jgi:hypothetical protein
MDSKINEDSKIKDSMAIANPSSYASEMCSFNISESEKSKRRTIKKILL